MTAPDDPTDAGRAGDELLDVAVIGGSHGLAMAWHLAHERLRFVVLEACPEIGHTWQSRWDSLTLFTPTQYDTLPGMPFPGPPDTYPTKGPVAGYLKAYAAAFDLPVRLNARVTALIRTAEGFEIRTGDVSSAPARWWWRPGRSRCPSCRRPRSGWMTGDPAAQRQVPQPAGPAARAGTGCRRRQLRVPDRRTACRGPPGRPVDRYQGADAAAAPRGQVEDCSGG